jgi:hypothetical protein
MENEENENGESTQETPERTFANEQFSLIMGRLAPFEHGPEDGHYEREVLEHLKVKQLRKIVNLHGLEARDDLSQKDLVAFLLSGETAEEIREWAKNEQKPGCFKIGCMIYLTLFAVAMLCGGYYVNCTEEGQARQQAYQKEQREKKAAALAAAMIDDREMNAFCEKANQYYRDHSNAKNRIKQADLFGSFTSWFDGSLQSKEAPISEFRVSVDEISASRGGGEAGVSFVVCDRLIELVEFRLYVNGVSKGSDLYKQLSDFESGDKLIVSGKMTYNGYDKVALTGDAEDTWSAKMEKGLVKHLLESKDSEWEEREVMARYWFKVDIETMAVAP